MNAGVFAYSATTLGLSFAFSLVGCFLALHSFTRGIRAHGRGRRVGWLLLGTWALVASAVWDMFFVAAIDLQTGGLPVRYEIVSIIANIAVSVVVSAIALWLAVLNPTPVRVLLGGAFIGAVMAIDTVLVLTAIRVNAVVTFSSSTIVWLTVLMAIATAPSILLAVRSSRRGAVLGAAVFLATMLTVVHYLAQYAITISQPAAEPVTSGIIPLAVTLPVAAIVILRVLLLLVVMLSNTATTGDPAREGSVPSGAV